MSNFGRLLGYLRPYRNRVAIAVGLMILVTLSTLPMPQITRRMIDVILPRKQWSALNTVFWIVVAIYAVRGICSFLLNYLIGWLAQRVVFDLRSQAYRHLNRLSLSYYDQRQTGKIMARVVDDINVIQYMVGSGFVTLITDLLTIILVVPLLFWMDHRLAWIALAVVPLYVGNFKFFLRKIRPLSVTLREKWDALLGTLQEKLAGISVVKAFVREDHETDNFMHKVQDNFDLGMQQAKLNRTLSAIATLIRALGTGFVYWAGGRLVYGRDLQVGELVAFVGYLNYLYDPAVRLVDFNVQAQWAGAATDRVFEVLDTRPEIVDSPDAVPLRSMRGDVEFSNVTFAYTSPKRRGEPEEEAEEQAVSTGIRKWISRREKPEEAPAPALPPQLIKVLRDVNLKVSAGEVIAIVGPSGAGKTTIVNLIARFYDVSEGSILIDGIDVRKIRLESIRRQIGYVAQESLLFSVSIRENIRYGRGSASEEDIVEAAKIADLHDFIMTLPEGYDTKIGEEGIKLSVGQKQRLAIARAALTDPRILILDDATSALDSHTEANVQKSLDRLMKGRTNFVIAHRLSTIMSADRIVVVDRGRIQDVGTHEELVARAGVYQNLFNEQYKSAQDEALASLLG